MSITPGRQCRRRYWYRRSTSRREKIQRAPLKALPNPLYGDFMGRFYGERQARPLRDLPPCNVNI